MEELGMTRSELARQLGSSPAYVTQMLRGKTNFTLDSMVKIARSLDGDLAVRICPHHTSSEWFTSESVIFEEYSIDGAQQASAEIPSEAQFATSARFNSFKISYDNVPASNR